MLSASDRQHLFALLWKEAPRLARLLEAHLSATDEMESQRILRAGLGLPPEPTCVAMLLVDSRRGLQAFHGGQCSMAGGIRPENPAECEDEQCRSWATRLESAQSMGKTS